MINTDFLPKQIFVLITTGFCVGIGSYDWINNTYLSFFIAGSFLFVAYLYFGRKSRNWQSALSIVLLFASIGFQAMEVRVNSGSHEIFLENYVSQGGVEATIVDLSYSDKTWNKAIFELKYIFSNGEKIPIQEKVLFLIEEGSENLAKGDVLRLNSSINPIKNKGNPGEFDALKYWKSKGITHIGFLRENDFLIVSKEKNIFLSWFNSLDRKLSNLFEDKLRPESVGIAKALILGDRDHLNSESVRAFGNTGALHVLAVSGLHIGLILALLIFVIGLFSRWVNKYQATIIALVIIWFYALITGFSPSVIRAVVMFSLLTIAKLSGRNYDSINVLMASALIILMYDPLLMYDLGFQLSYLAMLGIFLLFKPINSLLFFANRWVKLIWEGTAVGLAAQVFTLPLSLYCFHQFPNYFWLSNIGLMLLTNLILIAGICLISFHAVPFISSVVAWVLSILVLGMFLFVQRVEVLPASVAYGFDMQFHELVLLYFVVFFILLALKNKGSWSYVGIVLVFVTISAIEFFRFSTMKKNEFVVFNESHLTFLVKMEDEIHCFYLSDENLHKSMALAQNYQKIRPGNLIYTKLTDGKFALKKENFRFSCTDFNSYFAIEINQQRWKLIKKITTENISELDKKCIYMPWLDLKNELGHLLNRGAFVAKI